MAEVLYSKGVWVYHQNFSLYHWDLVEKSLAHHLVRTVVMAVLCFNIVTTMFP